MKAALASAILATSLGTVSAPAVAAPYGISIDVAPPAPRVERVPEGRRGWVWTPGTGTGPVIATPGCRARGSVNAAAMSTPTRSGTSAMAVGNWNAANGVAAIATAMAFRMRSTADRTIRAVSSAR